MIPCITIKIPASLFKIIITQMGNFSISMFPKKEKHIFFPINKAFLEIQNNP